MNPISPLWFPPSVRLAALLAAGVCAAATAQETTSQPPVRYTVHLEQPQTQRLTVEMTVDLPEELVRRGSVDVRFPAWRPGRYVILDPAGGVIDFTASSGSRPLEATKTDKATWRIDLDGADRLTVRTLLYANDLGLRTRHVDDSHAYLSGSGVFTYVEELRSAPLHVHFEAPDDWRIASGLEPVAGAERTLRAPSFDVLVDSPIEIGLHDRVEFEVAGRPHEIVVWPAGRRFDRQRLVTDFSRIIERHLEIFGELPYRRYVFLVHAGAGAGGGTEHLNSTIMQVPLDRLEGSLSNDDAYRRFLGLVSHEFFHTWNVKQVRPASLAPYDFQEENYSTLFWVAEGTTSYYDSLTLAQTGLVEEDEYLEELAELVEGSRERPGTQVQSLSESSFDAWIKFGRPSPDAANTTVSFYSQGALASLVLDLQIREHSGDEIGLDHVLRALYERYPLKEGGYSRGDLEDTLRDVTGRDWTGFFRDHVDGTEPLPLEEALATVGLELYEKAEKPRDGARDPAAEEEAEPAEEDESEDEPPRTVADAGVSVRDRDGRPTIRRVEAEGAFWRAGLLPGDELVALNGRRVEEDEWDALVESFEPGETVDVHFVRHGTLRVLPVELGSRRAAAWTVRRFEEPSAEQTAAYEAWMRRPWPADEADDGADQP